MRIPAFSLHLIDILDVTIVTFLIYQLFLLIRGTRAIQILQGVGILVAVMFLARHFQLVTLSWILHYTMLGVAVALPIVFQPELRRALEQIGRGGVVTSSLARLAKEDLTKLADELVWTTSILSQTKTGALIVIEVETGLEDFIERGTKVEGEVSSKLLLSIFLPKSPLHDGAVILRGKRVMAAGCYLPLSDSPLFDQELGTRHRAAVGVTEETDSVSLIVSEETGEVSLAHRGKLTKNISEETLKKMIVSLCIPVHRRVAPQWSSILGSARSRLAWFKGVYMTSVTRGEGKQQIVVAGRWNLGKRKINKTSAVVATNNSMHDSGVARG